jgi:hypothetical protein
MSAVQVTVTYLEMEHPAMLRAKRSTRDDITLERVDPPDPAPSGPTSSGATTCPSQGPSSGS